MPITELNRRAMIAQYEKIAELEARIKKAQGILEEWTLMVTEYEETLLTLYKIERMKKALGGYQRTKQSVIT